MSEKKKAVVVSKAADGNNQKNRIPDNISGAEKLNELIERGKKNGKLTTNEMMELDGVELDSSTLDRFYDILENLGIALVTEYELPETEDAPVEELTELKEEEVVDPNTMVESFGIEDGRTRTLEEVGKQFHVTRERIRQIEAKALRKLRHPSRSKKLKDFLN